MPNDDETARKLDAHYKEYEALRSEIEWLIRDGAQYQNFAIVLLGSIGAVADWMLKDATTAVLVPPTLLFAVFLFCLLGFLFFRQHEEVYVVASYILNSIRPQVVRLTADDSVWRWEEFKRSLNGKLYRSRVFNRLPMSTVVLWLRMALFVVPSLVIMGILYAVYLWPESYPGYQITSIRGWLWAGYVVDAAILLGLVAYLTFEADLPKRILNMTEA